MPFHMKVPDLCRCLEFTARRVPALMRHLDDGGIAVELSRLEFFQKVCDWTKQAGPRANGLKAAAHGHRTNECAARVDRKCCDVSVKALPVIFLLKQVLLH